MYTLNLLLAAALAAPLSAKPILQKRSFAHHVRRSHNYTHPATGSNAVFRAFRKYAFDLGDMQYVSTGAPVVRAAQQADTGSVANQPANGAAEYVSQVSVGGQTLVLDFDTGSSDLWVFSTDLPSDVIGSHQTFNPQDSKTFQPLANAEWNISYGDGSAASGVVGRDVVDIGGATAPAQAVELAQQISSSFAQDQNSDGLVGLAFKPLNTVTPQKQNTFFESIMSQLAMPVFSADLQANSSGTYLFGAVDNSKFTGQLTSVAINQNTGFWQVAAKSFSVGGQTQQNSEGSDAIIDTGTSLLIVDPSVYQAYYSSVQGAQESAEAGGMTYPCDADLPDLGVAVGDYMATVPGNVVTFAQVDGQTCFGGVQSNQGNGLQIYGDVFFRGQYVVFDGGNMAVQMAPKAG